MEREITTFENSPEGTVSKRKHPRYRSGRSRDWLKVKNPNAPAVKREAEEDWGRSAKRSR
jgi:ATP-dependent DNA ligase